MDNNDTIAESSIATGRPRFYDFPRKVVWDSIKDFHIYQGVPLIRGVQFVQASIGGLGKDVHHVFLQSAPYLKRGSEKFSVDRWITKSCYYAGVRITPNAGGITELVPDENSLMKFRFREYPRVDTSEDGADIWTGRVVPRSREWFATTQTDFCVLLTMSRHGDVPPRVYRQEQYCHNSQLEQATIELTYNTEAVARELAAIEKFCDDEFQPKLFAEIRQAFVSHPLPRTSQTGVNLSRGPQGRGCDGNAMAYQKYIDALRKQERTNFQQLAVLEVAKSMYPRLACIAGPPGTGKTRSLRQLVTGLRYSGHSFLVIAPSNATVDTDAADIYQNLPEQLRKTTKMLRLGVGAQAMLTQTSHTDFEGLEHTDAGEYKDIEGSADSELASAIQETAVELAAFEDEHDRLKQLGKDVDNAKELYRLFQASRRLKNSNVPVGMTMSYRIWELMQEDRLAAEEQYEALKATYSPHRWADLINGPGISVNDYNPSHNYKEILDLYVEKDGKLSGHDKKTFYTLRWEMLTRVLRETQIIFTTCNTAGGPLLATGAFQPTIICCDDAAQATCPGLFVSMTSFTKWEGVFLFGDETQLQPIQLAASANEFVENSKLSAFRLLMLKDFPQVVRLYKQYRMAGAIAYFPGRQFYDGELRNDSTVHRSDNVRDEVLAFTREELDIKGPNGFGSEYVIVNVAYGIARQEKTGKSIVNHANADCMIEFLTALIGRGFDARTLKVLCYYRGQMRLMRTKIDEQVETEEENGWTKKKKRQIEVSTVDAFHGKESDIVLLDFVAAKDNLLPKTAKDAFREEDDDEDQGLEEHIRYDRATAHVKDAHRLCFALTRARWGLFVFCQQALLERSIKMNKTKASNSVAFMINDARERDLIFNDYAHEDTSEDGQAMLLRWNAFKLKQAREKQLADDLDFANKVRAEVKRVRNAPMIKEKVKYPVYKSGTRRTTRIIGSRVETDPADEFDSSYLIKSNTKTEAPFQQRSLQSGKSTPEPAADKEQDKDETMTDGPNAGDKQAEEAPAATFKEVSAVSTKSKREQVGTTNTNL